MEQDDVVIDHVEEVQPENQPNAPTDTVDRIERQVPPVEPSESDDNDLSNVVGNEGATGTDTTVDMEIVESQQGKKDYSQLTKLSRQYQTKQNILQRIVHWAESNVVEVSSFDALQLRHERLESTWKDINDIFSAIVELADSSVVMAYEQSLEILEETFFEAAENLRQAMTRIRGPEENEQGEKELKVKVQLPTTPHDIKRTWGDFDGSALKWMGFRDRFKAAIHDKEDIDQSYKFAYLKQSLKGAAAAALGEGNFQSDCYEDAWQRLKELYEKPYVIGREHLRQFYRLPVLQSQPTSMELQRMSNVSHEMIRQLKALKQPVEHWDLVIVHNLHERLDENTAKQWELERKTEWPKATEMLEFLDKQAAALANVQSNRNTQISVTVGNELAQHQSRNTGQVENRQRPAERSQSTNRAERSSSTSTARNTGAIPKRIECEACPFGSKSYHPLYHCPSFESLNLNGRKDFVVRRKLCPNCLYKGHRKESCRSVRCTLVQCQADPFHNSLICPYKWDQPRKTSSQTMTTEVRAPKRSSSGQNQD